MKQYILSGLFTLIPEELYTPEFGKEALCSQFSLNDGYIFNGHRLNGTNAVVAYALKEEETVKEGQLPEPFAIRLMEECDNINEYNKVVFHYSGEKNLSHTVIATGGELKMANSFKADSFESALYFLFLSIKQLQMNPRQCTVRVCSAITPQQEETIARFFSGVETNNLDNQIL